jgi:Na+/citrate or Na+/malate symporter
METQRSSGQCELVVLSLPIELCGFIVAWVDIVEMYPVRVVCFAGSCTSDSGASGTGTTVRLTRSTRARLEASKLQPARQLAGVGAAPQPHSYENLNIN